MWLPSWEAMGAFLLAAILSAPAWGYETTNANSAVPGTLNYVEGQTSISKEVLNSKSIGSAEVQPGQSLDTGNGKAEVLLTPGVFLRVGDNSSVKMISPSLTNTEVGVNQGEAMIEVAEIHPENYIRVTEDGATAQLLKTGLYDFDQKQQELRVFDGKALVEDGGAQVKVKGGHELSLASGAPLKANKFDKDAYQENDLYRWSDLRSEYLAEANVDAARIYEINGWGPWGAGWWGAGWYWDPWFSAYTFIPGDGFLYGPFGCVFYSPWWVYRAPLYWYGFGHGYRPHYHTFSVFRWSRPGHFPERGVYRSGPGRFGVARGFGGVRGRGFGGSMGGFHGGGFHRG